LNRCRFSLCWTPPSGKEAMHGSQVLLKLDYRKLGYRYPQSPRRRLPYQDLAACFRKAERVEAIFEGTGSSAL